MLSTVLANVLSFLPQGGIGTSTAPVVINEFSYDDSGAPDDRVFIELFNRTVNPIDISNWSLVSSTPTATAVWSETFAAGTVMLPGDFLVVGMAAVPNVDIVIGFDFLGNENQSITLYDTTGTTIIDTLIYESNKGRFDPALAEAEGVWGNCYLVEGNDTTYSRLRDGFDTNNNGNDFRQQPATPGASNNLPEMSTTFSFFDSLTQGSTLADWQGSFVTPTVLNPTVSSIDNPSAIAASPQGGNAVVCWDPAGGGNYATMAVDPGVEVLAECYVYIESTPLGFTTAGSNERESWSFGLGTTGTLYNLPDPTGTLGFTANGNTGVSWVFTRDDSGSTMYFIDHNDGGRGAGAISDWNVIGSVPIIAGVNDGWQRVLVQVSSGVAIGRFGGSFAGTDGTLFTTPVDSVPRAPYIGYREFIQNNDDARPFTFDQLLTTSYRAAYAKEYGVGCDNLTLTPNSLPTLGNATFGLDVGGANLPIAFVGFGSQIVNPGVDLGFIGMAGCNAYTNLDIDIFPTGPVVGGVGTFTLPISTTVTLAGGSVSAQGLSLTLATTLNINASNGVALGIGY